MVYSHHASFSVRFFILVLGLFLTVPVSPGKIRAQTYPFTLDFEDGALRGWSATGNAFERQPVRGETRIAEERGQPSRHQGSYWISTYQEQPRAGLLHAVMPLGDVPRGTLISASFAIPEGRLTFLVGGGSSSRTRVELLAGPSGDIEFMAVVHAASGRNSESMERVSWDLSPYAGKVGRIRLVDESSESWGHINADDFRFVPPARLRVAVPGVIGDTEARASEKLAAARLTVGQVAREESSRTSPGTVFRQEPVAGRMVVAATAVHLWVAARETTIVPDLSGRDIDEARDALERARLRLGGISGQREGIVLEQRPRAGAEVPVDTIVDLVVAFPEMVTVPRVIGHSLEEAEELLVRLPLGVGRIEELPSDARAGTVIEQRPAPGARVGIDSRVDLVIAVLPSVRILEVPDVTGLPLAKARRILAARRLVTGEVSDRESDREAGIVLEQRPAAGFAALPGDAVDLVVAARDGGFPFWPVIVVLAGAGAAGVVLLRLRRHSRRKAGSTERLAVVPRVDDGFQEISVSAEQEPPGWEVTLHPVPDPGDQALEVQGTLIVESEGEND